jgi:CheY-like chemotaxis protein
MTARGGDEAGVWARLVEAMPLGAFSWTGDGAGGLRFVAANAAAQALTLASAGGGGSIGDAFFQLFPVSTLPAALLDAAHTQRAARLAPLVGRDGRIFAAEIVPLGDGAVGVLLNVMAEAEGARSAPSSAPWSPRSAAPASAPAGRSGNILVVDDEPLVGRLVERALGRGHRVTALTTGREGLDLLAAGERFDIILCDLMMPEITGMDLYERVLGLDAEQAERMVFLTGGAFTRRATEFLERRPFLEKPFDLSALEALVRQRLG